MGIAVYGAVWHTGKYVWHCWIRRDYKEPRFEAW
jgi:hypothetical protein